MNSQEVRTRATQEIASEEAIGTRIMMERGGFSAVSVNVIIPPGGDAHYAYSASGYTSREQRNKMAMALRACAMRLDT